MRSIDVNYFYHLSDKMTKQTASQTSAKPFGNKNLVTLCTVGQMDAFTFLESQIVEHQFY